MLRLVRLQFNNTKPKVSFTVKSASYHACSFVLTSLNSHLSNKNTPSLVPRIPHCRQTRYYSTRHVCWKRSQRPELEDG